MTHSLRTAHELNEVTSNHDFCVPAPEPRVLVACEDLAIGYRACDAFASMVSQSGGATNAQFSLWRLNSFASPEWRRTAARRAARADLIIVAVRGGRRLPAHLTTWLAEWPQPHPPRACARVVLFDFGTET